MAVEREALRDWHRLFGLLLTDFFSGSPFTVEVERDLSQQQQRLDVVIVRRGRGRFAGTLPDGLDDLAAFPGSRVIDGFRLSPGTDPSIYAYVRTTVHRNLFRIPLPR